MNIRTTLMMLAATAAPIYAQVTEETSAHVYSTMVGTGNAATASINQRAAAYPALAYIPADAEMVITLNHAGPGLAAIAAMSGNAGQLPPGLNAINGISIAFGKGLGASLACAGDMYSYVAIERVDGISDLLKGFNEWGREAAAPANSVIKNLTEAYVRQTIASAVNGASSLKLPPLYAVISTNGTSAIPSQWKQQFVAALTDNIDAPDPNIRREPYSANGFEGIKITILPGIIDQPPSRDNEIQAALREAFNGRTIYVMVKQIGSDLIAVICERPQDIQHAATPAQSILGTSKLSAADAQLQKNPILLSYAAPGISAEVNRLQMKPLLGMGTLLSDIFGELSRTPGANQRTMTAAATGARVITNTVSTLTKNKGASSDMALIWFDNSAVEIQITMNSSAFEYVPGRLALTSLPDRPETVLYCESSPWVRPGMPTTMQLTDSIVNVVDGFIATMPQRQQAIANRELAQARQFLPELRGLISASETICSGLGNSYAFAIDNAGSFPTVLGGKPGNSHAFPRISFYAGVTDRSKLGEGWEQLLTVAGNVAAKTGSDPAVVHMLPIVPSTSGNATSYSVALPWFSSDFVPNITVSDTGFTMGTSSAYNGNIISSATGSMEFCGCVATLNMRALATTSRGIANAMREAAGPQTPTGPARRSARRVKGRSGYIAEDDYASPRPTTRTAAMRRAEDAAEIAQALETAAIYVQRVDATATTSNGAMTTRIRVKLNM